MPDTVIAYLFVAILTGITGTWCMLLRSMWKSFQETPYLDEVAMTACRTPMVSVILPARNEEKFIAKCLDSLEVQDYSNYEIIAIDDASDDATGRIMAEHASRNDRIVHVTAGKKPKGWTGKNWACVKGYEKARGEMLLFTDADTKHSSNVISLAVKHMEKFDLDALTVIPRLLALDAWTRVTLPMICTFLHTRFSALRVNDPEKNTGYFFGSFFIMKKYAYEIVGTHKSVRQEIIEDGALGKKVKESGQIMMMVRGEHLIEAVWARDGSTLWHALKRLMVPLYVQNRPMAVGIFVAVTFLLLVPFPVLAYAAFAVDMSKISSIILLAVSATTVSMIYAAAIAESLKGLGIRLWHAMFAPVGSMVIVAGFLSGLIDAHSNTAISWRGRKYVIRDNAQSPINL